MSVGVVILEPQNEYERNFFIPVASESVFYEYWVPAIKALDLQWIKLFGTGVDVEEEDVPSIIYELNQLREWVITHLGQEQGLIISERVDQLQKKLPQAFQRKNAIVFIG